MAKIQLGAELGLNSMQSLIGIHIVEGKPMVSAVTLAAFVRQKSGYDYHVVELTNERCAIEFLRNGEVEGVSEFTIEDAQRAGLVKDKSGWVKYPRNMLFSRTMSNGVKWFAPDATHGIPVYYDGEIEARAVEEPSEPVSLAAVMAEIPHDLRDRAYAAYQEACDLRPGFVTPAAIQMSVAEQSRERVVAYLERIEQDNARARDQKIADERGQQIVDAVVVESSPVGEANDTSEGGDLSPVPVPEVAPAALRQRREELLAILRDDTGVSGDPDAISDQARFDVDAELEQIETWLREAAASAPGQESLDV
jgi:hypothetical protein